MSISFFFSRAVTDPRDGRRVALKKLPNVFQSLVSSKRVFRELKMLCFFKHENVSHVSRPRSCTLYIRIFASAVHLLIASFFNDFPGSFGVRHPTAPAFRFLPGNVSFCCAASMNATRIRGTYRGFKDLQYFFMKCHIIMPG